MTNEEEFHKDCDYAPNGEPATMSDALCFWCSI